MKIQKRIVFEGKTYEFLSDDSRELDSSTLFVRTKRNAAFMPVADTRADLDSAKLAPESSTAKSSSKIAQESNIATESSATPESTSIPFIDAHDLAQYFAPLPRIIGITGTNGKTTTAALIYSLLLDLGHSCALLGTRGAFKDEVRIREKGLTTPGALELYAILDEVRGCEFLVMEVSSHAIDQERCAGVDFYAKVLTNITSDHLDYHKTIDEYVRVKNSFFADDALKIINADEPKARYNPANAYTYGIERAANLKVDAYSLDSGIYAHVSYVDAGCAAGYAGGLAADAGADASAALHTAEREQSVIEAKLYGKHNLYNILAALLCVKEVCKKRAGECGAESKKVDSSANAERGGVDSKKMESEKTESSEVDSGFLDSRARAKPAPKAPRIADIAQELLNFGGVEGRMEIISEEPLIIVDFAHTHDGMEKIFESFKARDVAVVFGAGGDRDAIKRPKMGACAYQYARKLYITSDNPRSEDPQKIIDEILTGLPKERKKRVVCDTDRRAIIAHAVAELESNEVLLILGKGDEKYQIIGDEKYHFDDKEEALKALNALKTAKNR